MLSYSTLAGRRLQASILAAGLVVASACMPGVSVRTTQSPGATLAAYRTFRILPAPARRADAPTLAEDDPMLDNSITNRALRDDLARAFAARGYRLVTDSAAADFDVAYYAGTKDKFDTTYWEPGPWRYGYWGFRERWAWPYWGEPPVVMQVEEHTQGTVIVDVIDTKSRQLAWRGQGKADVDTDQRRYSRELEHAVDDVVARFPRAPQGAVADRRTP